MTIQCESMTDGEFRYWKRQIKRMTPWQQMVSMQRRGQTFTEIAAALGMSREAVIKELYWETILER